MQKVPILDSFATFFRSSKQKFLNWLVSGSLSYRQAEVFKEQGNIFYSQKEYSDAFNCYTKAIGKHKCFSWLILIVYDLKFQTCL